MKAILEFELPLDAKEHLTAVHAMTWKVIVEEIDTYLRDQLKYHELDDEAYRVIEATRTYLHDSCTNRGVNLYE